MPLFRALLGTLVLVAALFVSTVPARAATLNAGELDLLSQINSFRAARGLPTVVASDTLTSAAKWMATNMATYNYFSHTSLDGRSPFQRMSDAGYPVSSTWTGEDLAAGYTSAAAVLNGWINSPAHLAVLTNAAYHAVGIGNAYSASSSYGWYWDADFGGIVDGGSASGGSTGASPAAPADSGYHSAYAGQSADPTLSAGQVATLVVALRNTGSRGWYVGSAGQEANLGTNAPTDVARPDLASNWLSANRLATTTTSYVGPGETGWFQFQVRAPSAPGLYRLDVRGVVDGTTWLEDSGIYFLIQVQ